MDDFLYTEPYKLYFDNMPLAFTVIEVILDEDQNPIDFIFRYANPQLARLEEIELDTLLGRRFFRDVFPKNNDDKWLKYYYASAYDNQIQELHEFSVEIKKYLKITCYPWMKKGLCACILADETEFINAQKYLDYLAHHDLTTNTYNKNSYVNYCTNFVSHEPVGAIYVDINGLKECNDRYGHQTGDFLIKVVTDSIKSSLSSDKSKAFRVGGDEFVIILEGCSSEEVRTKAEQLRHTFCSHELKHFPSVLASVGYYWSENPSNVEEVVQMADQQMYLDKMDYRAKAGAVFSAE